MTKKLYPGAKIRQDYIDFFLDKGHTFVPSSSLVPGGDQTLLFTNAGMVQFKDVFLGTDKRPYTRATNSQKCMRVAGKHNDLEDVGQDDTHHTFFEMLGNWSFGDYYKKEAIEWAWDLLTRVWGLSKDRLWPTVFKDELDEIPSDDEAAKEWRKQPGIVQSHILYFGRKDNFWEMAETGPCGPCSEIHYDRGEKYCNLQGDPQHTCQVNGDCQRFTELWNLVFIQYNRTSETHLEPLPATHVDTGMGFERIVSVLQDVDSNYKTDLFSPILDKVQQLANHTDDQRLANFTPYRVIADHARASAFLIADGVVPGNLGRSYICRMIIRRAARFGGKIGLNDPFLARVAEVVIEEYGQFYPELVRNRTAILSNLTAEEQRFQRTLESGLTKLESLMLKVHASGGRLLTGEQTFDLYATYGLPLEITRDIAREGGLDVDEPGFNEAMQTHRLASSAGDSFATSETDDIELYRYLLEDLQAQGKLGIDGVGYNPYEWLSMEGHLLALVMDGESVQFAQPGDKVEVLLPRTGFYVESGGQVSDTGMIYSVNHSEAGDRSEWVIQVDEMRKPAAGIIVHSGEVLEGQPRVGDLARAQVDIARRQDIIRNHTATHLLHAELRAVLGDHARQAGSLVAPDRLRFDFTHPQSLTAEELERIEAGVNARILDNYNLDIRYKKLEQAIHEGAMALFGEKYSDTVRTITIGEDQPFSYELCGGTHVDETGDVGLFLITSEGSIAAGTRRIEAVTGHGAYELVRSRNQALKSTAAILETRVEDVPAKVTDLLQELDLTNKQLTRIRAELANFRLLSYLERVPVVNDIPVLTAIIQDTDMETLRSLTDRFRQRNPSGVAVLASVGADQRPIIIAAVTEDLTRRGLHAGELVKFVAQPLGGGGGGRPTLAQAGGRDASKLEQALEMVPVWVENNLQDA